MRILTVYLQCSFTCRRRHHEAFVWMAQGDKGIHGIRGIGWVWAGAVGRSWTKCTRTTSSHSLPTTDNEKNAIKQHAKFWEDILNQTNHDQMTKLHPWGLGVKDNG